MVGPGASVGERLELAVCLDQPDYRGARARLHLVERYLTDGLVALVTPDKGIIGDGRDASRTEKRDGRYELAHGGLPTSCRGQAIPHPRSICDVCYTATTRNPTTLAIGFYILSSRCSVVRARGDYSDRLWSSVVHSLFWEGGDDENQSSCGRPVLGRAGGVRARAHAVLQV